MKKKVIYNREYESSKEVQRHREFNCILKQPQHQEKPVKYWKSIRFWGTVGTSAVALFLFLIN